MPLDKLLLNIGGRADAQSAQLARRVTTKLLSVLLNDGFETIGKAKGLRSRRAKNTTGSETSDARNDEDRENERGSSALRDPAAGAAGVPEVLLVHLPSGGTAESEVTKSQDKDGNDAAPSGSRCSEPSTALAREVGMNAQDYLEDCFYNEASVLDREKFDTIPGIIKSDIQVTGLLGKGSFCEVLEVVSKGDQIFHTEPKHGLSSTRRSLNSINSPIAAGPPAQSGHQLVFAIKRLRPQIQTDPEQFTIGAEDLVHETAILASLDHCNIINLHGRAPGRLAGTFLSNTGYFILLDKINETVQERIGAWRQFGCTAEGPQAMQMEVAHSIADATLYLHSKKIVYRNFKATNIGFDSKGVLKLFDFGFAISLPEKDDMNPTGLLFDKCGTPRYMAPEMGLSLGYGTEADVYSFGVLFWEMCALEQPFSSITSVEGFQRDVFLGEHRPALGPSWPAAVQDLISCCWSTNPSSRPSMLDIKSSLSLAVSKSSSE